MCPRKYYEAYNDRYCQIHELNLQWFHTEPSDIVTETIRNYSISPRHKILEIGCGEGRDAFSLVDHGFDLLATDVSPEAIRFCQHTRPEYADCFRILDCVTGHLEESFNFIYAVAVVHMLVADEDRNAFYRFIRNHLNVGGIALICSMGDGEIERQSDIRNAFELQDRIHEQSGTSVKIASTSCRMVSFPTFRKELETSGFVILKDGITSIEPDFTQIMYAVVK